MTLDFTKRNGKFKSSKSKVQSSNKIINPKFKIDMFNLTFKL